MSIPVLPEKIKGYKGLLGEELKKGRKSLIFILILIVLLGASFWLGYVARAELHREPLVLIECPFEAYINPALYAEGAAASPAMSAYAAAPSAFVASKNGTKYYPRDCSAAQKIKEGNRVYFESESAAEKAGYSPSASCN